MANEFSIDIASFGQNGSTQELNLHKSLYEYMLDYLFIQYTLRVYSYVWHGRAEIQKIVV